jgi:hypothetical protein
MNLSAPTSTVAALALAMDGSSGADLSQVVINAARRAVLGEESFEHALAEIAMQPLQRDGIKSVEQRSAFCAVAVDQLGLSHREVAKLLGVTHPTVGKLARHWRERHEPDPISTLAGAAS